MIVLKDNNRYETNISFPITQAASPHVWYIAVSQ